MSLASRWEQARLRFHRARIRHLIRENKWSRALTAVIDFAQFAEGRFTDAELWMDLTATATQIVAHLDDPAEYRAFLVHFAAPFLGDEKRARPELVEAFAGLADEADESVMISIGQWMSDARPGWSLGPYLMGHFGEQLARTRDDRTELAGAAAHFEAVAQRAQREGLDAWSLHGRLRQGALLLTTGIDRRRGRQILGDLDWTGLFPREQLWMAISLASSSRWTDRLRAMDIVLDLEREISRSHPDYRQLDRLDLRRAAAALFKMAGLDLPEAEDRRLEELSETLFAGDERRQWKSFLTTRRQLAKVAGLPFAQNDEVFPLLNRLSSVYPERWKPATQRFRILDAGWRGDYDSMDSVLSRRRRGQRLPIADATADLLSFLAGGDDADDELRDLLEKLCDALSELELGGDNAAARPVALVWPKILDEAPAVDLDGRAPELARLAAHYAPAAPTPSYGWWALAARLYDAGLEDAATPVAERALRSDGGSVDETLRRYVTTRTFRHAVDARDARRARRWLDAL